MEPSEKEKSMAEELAALREIVNQPKKQAEPKDDKLSESGKALAKNVANRLLELRAKVRQ